MAVLWWIMVKFFQNFSFSWPRLVILTQLCALKSFFTFILSLGTVLWLSIKCPAQAVSRQDKGDEGREIKTLLRPAFSALSLRGITACRSHGKAPHPAGDFSPGEWGREGPGAFKSKNKPLCCTAKYLLFKQKSSAFSIFDVRLNSTWKEPSLKLSGTKSCSWKCHQKSQTRFTHDCLHGFLSRFAYFKRCVSIGKHRRAFNIDHCRARGLSEPLDTDEIHLNTSILMK